LRLNKNYVTTYLFLTISCISYSQNAVNKYRLFVGVGNNNLVSDYTAFTDKTFFGEASGQARLGLRFYDNYELNFGVYGREYQNPSLYPGVTYNKFMGYSGALMYEFRKPDSRWGIPFGFEVLQYNRHLDSALSDGTVYYDHYDAFSYGPKIGVRFHFSKHFFLETEAEILYEKFKWEVNWGGKPEDYNLIEANSFSSFKFFGITANLAF
jgi:hypothetical protein